MKKIFQSLAAATFLALASGATQAAEVLKLLMPEPHGPTFRAIYTGIEKGWFKAENIEIEFLPIPGGAVNLVPQLSQGAGDIAWAGGYTIIQARARGAAVVGIQSASSESLWSLISHKDANIKTPADLKGKTVGVVAFSSATHFMAKALLKAANLTEADVNIRPIGMGGPALISQKQVDAYIWFRTQGLGLREKGAPVELMTLDPHIPLPQDPMLAMESNIAKRRDVFKAYLRVLKRAEDYALDAKTDAEVDGYQAKYAPQTVTDTGFLRVLSQEVRDRAARDRQRNWRWGSTDAKRLADAQDFLIEIKVIDQKTPIDAMFTDSLLP